MHREEMAAFRHSPVLTILWNYSIGTTTRLTLARLPVSLLAGMASALAMLSRKVAERGTGTQQLKEGTAVNWHWGNLEPLRRDRRISSS